MKYSVCVPIFNGMKYLDDTLRSIKGQTLTPFETVILDDGSSDFNVRRAKKFTRRVFKNGKNMGIGFSRQKLAELAKGDYVCFLSSDDVYHATFLERVNEFADGEHAIFSDYHRCDPWLKRDKTFLAPEYTNQEEFKKLAIEWALKQNMFVNFSCVCLPKWVFEHVKFDSTLRYGEDLLFLLETIVHDVKWLHIDMPLLYYRVHPYSGTVTAWNLERRMLLWDRLSSVLGLLGVSEGEVALAQARMINSAKMKQFKSRIPSFIKTGYHLLKNKI